jgi:NRAMP (natural resistance-associated macrophage protein)-like metal ion transporter
MLTGEEFIKDVAEAPAIALDKTIDASVAVTKQLEKVKAFETARGYWNTLGPGLTTGAADDDPSGIATYSQQGAQTGLQLLWLAAFSFPLMAIVQEMCARIGIVTDRGLAANIRRNYPKWVLYVSSFLLLGANTLNLGADIGAMAKAVQLIIPSFDFSLLVILFTVFILALQIYTTYRVYAKYLKWLALILLSYILSALAIQGLQWNVILHAAFIPSLTLSKQTIFLITAVLGTTISPYLFFWQTSQEVEEKLERKHGRETQIDAEKTFSTVREEIKKMRLDVWNGMFISNVVMFFIILATAVTLFTRGITTITTAADAAEALRPIAGQYVYLLFAIGIIGSGLLAVPILAGSASYAISETFGWKTSLSHKLKDAYPFYGVIIIAMLVGLGLNFIGLDPIKALIYSAILNGLISPLILFFIVRMSSNEKLMRGKQNHPFITFLGWATIGLMTITAVATIVSSFF